MIPKKIKKILLLGLNSILPLSSGVKVTYWLKFGKLLDFNNMTTWNEKLHWMKLYDHNPLYTKCADKVEVRNYVEEKIGGDYLVPIFGIYDSFDKIDVDKIPDDKFVIKCNHDTQSTKIVTKKEFINNKRKLKSFYARRLRQNLFNIYLEWQYKNIEPKILVEKFLGGDGVKSINDYKFFCFNGVPRYIQVDADRFTNHCRNFYDLDWNLQDVKLDYEQIPYEVKKPKNLGKMIELVKRLSQDFHFVRVDLYSVDNKIYFSELTFIHDSGYGTFDKKEWNEMFGDLIELPKDVL